MNLHLRSRPVLGTLRSTYRRFSKSTPPSVPLQILGRVEELHRKLQPLNDRLQGPLEKHSYRTTALPFVLLLGNHSSGKSSFVNYVLGRRIQTAGVAPTDDSFTIIAPGDVDVDQDGPALVGDPDMGFNGLRHFGPALIHHMRLKIRSETSTSTFMIVDTPGMIDSPVDRQGGTIIDRGYDFEGTVRWFAERADVILLFFDPDKPGTTGETLSILTNSLSGLDHKLHIVLNKADQFRKIHDFARAYGSLCWNLSKVIVRKDLPRIYTMCLPVPSVFEEETRIAVQTVSNSVESEGSSSRKFRYTAEQKQRQHKDEQQQRDCRFPTNGMTGLSDLQQTRKKVVAEVHKAPKRRVDNMITRLSDSVHLLHMHATILELAQKEYSRMLLQGRLLNGGIFSLSVSAVASAVSFSLPIEVFTRFSSYRIVSCITRS